MKYYAHTYPDYPQDPRKWQPLEEHLKAVAEMAAEFAKPIGGEEWAYLAGLWHDLGKYSNEFQKRLYDANGVECHLETKPGKVVHSEAGGHWAQLQGWQGIDRILCWLIMGHHAGLADYGSGDGGAAALETKMRRPEMSRSLMDCVPQWIQDYPRPAPPKILAKAALPGDIAFFIRMLFSCLVDADFLDTESFMDRKRAQSRKNQWPVMMELLEHFEAYMQSLCKSAKNTEVNRIRAEVLHQCQEAADVAPGVFALTVPTGGGKTLASMAFALRHAVKYGKRRIIYVIPYTSIIEQTADVFRQIPGFESVVLEHHSNLAESEATAENVRSRLASENWDMPIIVTTSVQFFESLYAVKTSRCRKLHNIANSVVIFDEAQCLPSAYLRPVVFAVRELQRHYGVTPVLCTATQPVLTKRESFDFRFREGFEEVHEITKEPDELFRKLKRVNVSFPEQADLNIGQLAGRLREEASSVLCIVNTRDDARELAQALSDRQPLHLSTNMCAAHRTKVLDEIKQRIREKTDPVIVISTSLVEAGVDLDFPVVYRALGGLDSIAQAAGRCNREGREDTGRTQVYVPEKQPDYVKSPASLALEYLTPDAISRALDPETFRQYFGQRFFQIGEDNLDAKSILKLFSSNLEYAFRTAADRFRLIEDDWQLPIVVPYGEAQELIDRLLEHEWESRMLLRRLQRYTINISKQVHGELISKDHARELSDYPGITVLYDKGLYTEPFGFVPPGKIDAYSPETMIG